MVLQQESLVRCAVHQLRFDGRVHHVIGAEDNHGRDVYMRDASGVVVVAEPARLRLLVEECGAGWLHEDPLFEAQEGAEEVFVVDVEPVQEWLRGRAAFDPIAGLDLWNVAVDVSFTVGLPFRHRGRTADVCYDKLFASVLPRFAATVPGDFEPCGYRPVWSPAQYRVLRRVMGEALHVLRVGVADSLRRSTR